MIFIDYTSFRPPSKWKKKAKRQLRGVASFHAFGNLPDRNLRIDNRNYVWSEIKTLIINSTVNKCWFTEGTSDVSHFQIEHFRPKKLVKILPAKFACPEQRTVNEPNSYWWLTFNYKNFRICGQVTNSNKGNYFPLKQGSPTANLPSSDITTEQVILLDPTVESDTKLLTFDINGTPIPSANPTTHPYDYLRAVTSIKVYGLKDGIVHDARKRKLADLKILVDKINNYDSLLQANPTNFPMQQVIQQECSLLVAMTHKNQPFSKMVTVFLSYIPYQWASDYVHPFI